MSSTQISRSALDIIATTAATISDNDLPPPARRNRSNILRDKREIKITKYDAVTIPNGEANVVGPGRGIAFICVAFIEDGVNHYGTFHKREVEKIL